MDKKGVAPLPQAQPEDTFWNGPNVWNNLWESILPDEVNINFHGAWQINTLSGGNAPKS